MVNESDLIIKEIEKTRKLFEDMDKYIIIKTMKKQPIK